MESVWQLLRFFWHTVICVTVEFPEEDTIIQIEQTKTWRTFHQLVFVGVYISPSYPQVSSPLWFPVPTVHEPCWAILTIISLHFCCVQHMLFVFVPSSRFYLILWPVGFLIIKHQTSPTNTSNVINHLIKPHQTSPEIRKNITNHNQTSSNISKHPFHCHICQAWTGCGAS